MTTYIYPDEFYVALKAVDFQAGELILEGEILFTSEAEHRTWLIEAEAMRGGCEHMTEDHQPVGDGWSVCTACAAPNVLPSGLPQGCVWRYGYGAGVRDYLAAVEQDLEFPDAYRYIPE